MKQREIWAAASCTLLLVACASAQDAPPDTSGADPTNSPASEGTRSANTLSWEELGVRLVGRETSAGLQIDVTTLNEDALAVAAEDIRNHLFDLKRRIPEAEGFAPEEVEEMTPLLVAFTGFEKEISFDPTRLILRSEGSTFYPVHILPVSPRFDRRLVGLYETVYGIYLFEPGIDFFANLEFQYADLTSGESWRGIVERVQRAKARRQTEINGPSS